MLTIILELLGEFLLQVVIEGLAEVGWRSVAAPFRRPVNPWQAALGYAIFGAIFGGLSLLFFPDNLVPGAWRVGNLILTPLAVGAVMMLTGAWRAGGGGTAMRLDRFAYGYLFALTLALVRFFFAR